MKVVGVSHILGTFLGYAPGDSANPASLAVAYSFGLVAGSDLAADSSDSTTADSAVICLTCANGGASPCNAAANSSSAAVCP